jgi:hypothetical protein
MPYEVRVNGTVIAVHERQRDALAQVKELVARDPDVAVEIIDTATGRAAAPAASVEERQDFARKVGF